MQTIYYHTPNYIRRTGNVIDLNEYRSQLSAVTADLTPELPQAAPVPARPRRSEQRRAWHGMALELISSAAVLLTTLVVTAQFL